MPDKRTSQDIAANVAKKTEKISSDKSAPTQELANRKQELLELLDSYPPAIQAQTLAISLVQLVPRYFFDPEEAESVTRVLRSKPFLRHLKGIVDEQGISGALDEMANLDLDNDAELFAMFTGEQLSDDEIIDMFAEGN